jgi:hypothetical protein
MNSYYRLITSTKVSPQNLARPQSQRKPKNEKKKRSSRASDGDIVSSLNRNFKLMMKVIEKEKRLDYQIFNQLTYPFFVDYEVTNTCGIANFRQRISYFIARRLQLVQITMLRWSRESC